MKAALSIMLVEALSILLVADACCTGIPCGRIVLDDPFPRALVDSY
jgi:hypothetical protein